MKIEVIAETTTCLSLIVRVVAGQVEYLRSFRGYQTIDLFNTFKLDVRFPACTGLSR